MNVQEIIKKFTLEDGSIDQEKLTEEIENQTKEEVTKQVGATLSKQKEKINTKKDKNDEEKLTEELNGDKYSEIIKELKSQKEMIDSLLSENTENKVQSFRKKAQEAGVSDGIINTLISSGADISSVNLAELAPSNLVKPKSIEQNENVTEEISEEMKKKNLIEEMKKKMRK